MKRSSLGRFSHPFDDNPFVVFYQSSWRPVERMRIGNGAIALNLLDYGYLLDEKGLLTTLRIRPRKAVSSDCTCLLRPGLDVCVVSYEEQEGEGAMPVLLDARINTIERRPHDSECTCDFYVNFYCINSFTGTVKRSLAKDIKTIKVDQILIYQRMEQRPCIGKQYRWNFAEDCTSVEKTKLVLGRFASDLAWMVVTSVQKQFGFDVRSVQNKIVYQILNSNFDNCASDFHLSALNLKSENELTVAEVIQFAPTFTASEATPMVQDVGEDNPPPSSSPYDVTGLRRSKRRLARPERYLGDIGLEPTDATSLRIGYKFTKCQSDYGEHMPLLLEAADAASDQEQTCEQSFHACDINSEEKFLMDSEPREEKSIVRGRKKKKKEALSLAIILPLAREKNRAGAASGRSDLQTEMDEDLIEDDVPLKDYQRRLLRKMKAKSAQNTNIVQNNNSVQKRRTYKPRKKVLSDLSYVEEEEIKWHIPDRSTPKKDDILWAEERVSFRNNNYKKRFRGKRHHPVFRRKNSDHFSEVKSSGKKTLDAGAYKELISTYMKNIQLTIENKQTETIDPWKNLMGDKCNDQKPASEEELAKQQQEEEEDMSETEMLFKEMEMALASIYLLEDEERSKAEVSSEKSSDASGLSCLHEFKLDEEIGIICSLCGHVITEIKDVFPEFLRSTGWTAKSERKEKDDLQHKLIDEASVDFVCNPSSSDSPLSSAVEDVWSFIPQIKLKLHPHQKKAFEFLWRNIAGSIIPAQMDPSSKKIGGCAISHTPGAGKTFLIIAFLVSYLKLFPGKRPLVLAPKTTLYTWYKEIIKWQFPVPVYQIHGRRTYRDRIYNRRLEKCSAANSVPCGDVMHVLDCLEKLQKWHAHPSVLLMGYTSFLSLMREDSKYAYRRYMGQILRESPGILILDEGHNPRSTKSRLRKALMRIETDIRILLSGTLFQNNFGEYFNTLSLARPKFVNEVLGKLDPKYKKKIKGMSKTRTSIENRARKVFIDIIARKINSDDSDERAEGINMLKSLTNRFIDVYEGGSAENLPGLQSYTLMMKPTPIQQEILDKLHGFMDLCRGFPLELELMITLGSIHPWLIKTAVCAGKFMRPDELQMLEQHKHDPTKGSKVKFVLGLIHRCIIKKEKVLIFCHNIAPITLFLELFQMIYGWRKGEEVLVLSGELELFERGRVMDKFEERGGSSKVMLASINACAEGISLTAASRVILLDSEWNPSKQKQAIARAFRPGQEKVVYVYQLLAKGTLEEDKYKRTTWKEWVSCMIFSEELVEDPSRWQAAKIEDALLREMVEEDHAKSFHSIMKNEKASYENPLKAIIEELG